MSPKSYANVVDMIREIANDSDVVHEVEQAIKHRKLISALLSHRAANGQSQADVANKLNCTQSRVSKLENSVDDDVRYGDLRDYASAVNCELLSCIMPNSLNSVDNGLEGQYLGNTERRQ